MQQFLPIIEPRSHELSSAVEALAATGGVEERGAVFTKPEIVECILDLSGYLPNKPLHKHRLLEPSFGDGEFLIAAVRRLITAAKLHKVDLSKAVHELGPAIAGVELHREAFSHTVTRVTEELCSLGIGADDAAELTHGWLSNDDFLLADIAGAFDYVVGNPPYVRQERVPSILLQAYKRRFTTLFDRADLYVLFYERGLDLLSEGGRLGFICANRWIKNKYGGPLRRKVAEAFALRYFIDLERANAFQEEVSAYPAITVVERSAEDETCVGLGSRDCAASLPEISKAMVSRSDSPAYFIARSVPNHADPWLLDVPHILELVRDLERRFPTIEQAGARVGIGVATGADKVFVGEFERLPVEDDRKLPMAMAADCQDGVVRWSGKGLINPFLDSGELASFDDYPLFGEFMETHGAALKRRHTAKRQPRKWYRTIDRVYPHLTHEPKLLIPDIKGEATVAYDPGEYYAHHNLYTVMSAEWDLRAMQAILSSSVALVFIAAYCVRMAGGFLRFQAQYLRRIRCPAWPSLADEHRGALASIAESLDQEAIDEVVFAAYGLSDAEGALVAKYASEARIPRKTR